MEDSVKRMLLLVSLSTLLNLTLFAQVGEGPKTARTAEKSTIHVPADDVSAALTKIYGNLGTKTDAYNDTEGSSLSGPNAADGFTQFVAMPFTPKVNASVTQVQVAVQYLGGANQINLSIYTDASGAPGTLLAGPVTVTNLPAFGTCCTLTVANFSPVAVTAGVRYWVTADTPSTGTGSDFEGVWDWAPKPIYPQARNKGKGWVGFDGTPAESAGEVLGTTP
jgi:hypothetical protein